jgi:hypothetical protein
MRNHVLTPTMLNYSVEIGTTKLRGANVFILFLDVRTAATLLEQAFNMSMLRKGTNVLCVGEIFDDDLPTCLQTPQLTKSCEGH